MPSRPALELGGNEVMARRTSASVAMRVTVSSAGGWMSRKSDGGSGCLFIYFILFFIYSYEHQQGIPHLKGLTQL